MSEEQWYPPANGGEGTVPTSGSTCYKLYPVWGNPVPLNNVQYSKNLFLANYVDDFVTVRYDLGREGYVDGCFFVVLSSECINPRNFEETYNGCPYEPNCYTIGGEGLINYVDINNNVVLTYAPAFVCSRTIPEVISQGSYGIIRNGDGTCTQPCIPQCYTLIKCVQEGTEAPKIYSFTPSLVNPYALNQIVTLDGYDGCWYVTVEEEVDCSCSVDVTVKKTYNTCEECLPIIAYKLTSCSNNKIIKYTKQDLSIYAGKSVSLDCGDCWLVELINYQPPSISVIVIENVYANCTACTRLYWKLIDCSNLLPPLITYTDMSTYLHKYVKLKNDNTCWEVVSTSLYEGAIEILVSTSYTDCDTCSEDTSCICTRITNTSNESKIYTYIDCNNITQNFTLAAGSVSDKICIKKWIGRYPISDIIETFGDCYLDAQTQIMTCPTIPTGRVVAPGYYVPTCSIEKYEEISCKSSEILYHQVLQARYGISNCCPDDDNKWLLQKEIIDLSSMLDKNYMCGNITECCLPEPCNCNSCIN